MNISVILAGGIGARCGAELPKQYQLLLGREMIAYVVDAVKQSNRTHKIVIVAGKDDIPRLKQTYDVDCTEAGDSHNASTKNGLDYIKTYYSNCQKVLFVDAARPFLKAETVDRYYELLDEFDGVITAQHITDSLGREGEAVVDRAPYYLIQKPEAFRLDMLYGHFSAESTATAIVQQMPQGARIEKSFDIRQNLKITYPDDLPLAEYLMGLHLKEGNK